MSKRRLYLAQSVMLLAVATPLAIAEGAWWYIALILVAVILGWLRTVRTARPLLGPLGSHALVIAAFIYLAVEYAWLPIRVMALAHFMILVCATKLLQQRGPRDDMQFFVLTLLMLVVDAIVSGNLLFPAALAVYITVGLDTLIRFFLQVEAGRIERRNRACRGIPLAGRPASSATAGAAPLTATPPPAIARSTIATAATALLAGALVFMFFPRGGAGLLHLESSSSGQALSGLAPSITFNTMGPIRQTDRPVMTVKLSKGGKRVEQDELYFRASVMTQYHFERTPLGGTWSWRRTIDSGSAARTIQLTMPDENGLFTLVPGGLEKSTSTLVQQYWIEPGTTSHVLACYPALALRFDSEPPEEVRKWIPDHVLVLQRLPQSLLGYTVYSADNATEIQDLLAVERNAEPRVLLPDAELPRAAQFRQQIADLRAGLSAPDPVNTREEQFCNAVVGFLHSARFRYTLQPPRPRGEPIGEFLFVNRQGHCEYFASAMALLCQLAGIPARVVVGYCGGEYNSFGGFYLVRQRDAHSWVEAYIPGKDWVRFDPTPPALQKSAPAWYAGVHKYLEYAQFVWATSVVSYSAQDRRELFDRFASWVMRPVRNEQTLIGAVAAFVRELFGWRLQLDWRERLIYWVFSLLVVTLVMLVAYVLWALARAVAAWVRSRLRRLPPAFPEAEFYYRFRRWLESRGLRRRPEQTPAEFAAQLAAEHPALAEAAELVTAYYAVAFGGQRLSGSDRARIEAFLQRAGATDLAGAGSAVR